MTDKTFPALQRGFAAVHQISISRKAHTTTDEAVELFGFVLEKHANVAAEKPLAGESEKDLALPRSPQIFSPFFGPKDYGTARLALQLAALDREIKEKALQERARLAHQEYTEKLEKMFPDAKRLPSGALVTADGKTILQFAPGSAARAIAELEAEEEEIARRTNPKGVPIIFPSYD